MNRKALQMAKEVAREKGLLFAGGTCLSSKYIPGDEKSYEKARASMLQLKNKLSGLSRKEQIL